MAHPCFECGGECHCHGDWDDIIVSHTPINCESCGCREFMNQEEDFDDDDYDDFDCCGDCIQPDACRDHGCAIKQGLRVPIL